MKVILCCAILVLAVATKQAMATCPNSSDDGVSYPSMPLLTASSGYQATTSSAQETFYWNFCAVETLTPSGRCIDSNNPQGLVAVCQANSFASTTYRSTGILQDQTIQSGTDTDRNGLTFVYSGGVQGSCNAPRQTTIYVDCDPTQDKPVAVGEPQEPISCSYVIHMKSKFACRDGSTPPLSPPLCEQLGFDTGPAATFDPFWPLHGSDGNATSCGGIDERALQAAPMAAALDQRKIAAPFDVFKKLFVQMDQWPAWNILFAQVNTTLDTFEVCTPLVASFHILPAFSFGDAVLGFPTIVKRDINDDYVHLSWAYRFATPSGEVKGFGRHDYVLTPGDCGSDPTTTWLMSWEKGAGSVINANRVAEEHTLIAATVAALDGASCVENVYDSIGVVDLNKLAQLCGSDPAKRWQILTSGAIYVP
jgi:hypothetical protein